MPELAEKIDYINKRLEQDFGRFEDGRPNWRVVFADDQIEKRWVQYNEFGVELLNPVVRERPKYRQWAAGFYLLERLVPVVGETDIVTKTSYEPAWTFVDKNGNYLPPRFDACKFIIESIYAQTDKANTHKKYKDPELDEGYKMKQIQDMHDILFGNETGTGDALAYKEGVAGFHETTEIAQKRESIKENNNA